MSIIQLTPFDFSTAAPWQILSTSGFWASLPRLTRGVPSARLLMVVDTMRPETVQRGFTRVAAPDDMLPRGVRVYRGQYDAYLKSTVEAVHYLRLYLVMDSTLPDEGLCNVLASYGVQAQTFDHEVPLPFANGKDEWNEIITDRGERWGMMRSKAIQFGSIFPRTLHRLFNADFPLWAALQIHTFNEQEAVKLLRLKATTARYSPRKTQDDAQEASEMADTVGRLRLEMNRAGALLHSVRLYVAVGGQDSETLRLRQEMVRGALPMEMERVTPAGETIRQVFSTATLNDESGSPVTSPGVAMLAGSALSYRRRTETAGIMLGTDSHQSPVIFNIFDERNPSYNMLVLGQTGSGKTFATLLLMLRHLLMQTMLIILDPQGNIDLSWLGEDIYHKAVLGTDQAAINIMDITHDQIGTQVESVCSMLSLLGVLRHGDPVGRAMLDDILMDIYVPIWGRTRVDTPTLAAVQRRVDQLSGSARIQAVRGAAELLSYTITPYTRGSYAALFGKPTTVDFSLARPVTVYDVSRLPKNELGGNLRSALLAILVADINQAIRRLRLAGNTTPIQFFVDELGVLMRDAVIASHVSSEYATARSRRVGMIVADQELHTLLGPQDATGLHHGAPILANSAFALLFYQRDSERQRIRESFPGLPEGLREMLFRLPRGMCLAQFPDDLLLVNVLPSAFERLMLSSQLHDQARKKATIKRLVEEVFG